MNQCIVIKRFHNITPGASFTPRSSSLLPQISNGPVTGSRKRPSEGNYDKDKEHCIVLFDQWSEADQVEFVEHLISRMCHYQHGHINSYLKPMLQRDFITALPGTRACTHSHGRTQTRTQTQ